MLFETDVSEYGELNSEFSEYYDVRIAPGDTARGIASFMMTRGTTVAEQIFYNLPSEFLIDLTKTSPLLILVLYKGLPAARNVSTLLQ